MKPCLKRNLGRAYYQDGASPANLDGALSKSMLWSFYHSQFKWRFGVKKAESEAMGFGRLFHSIALQPNTWREEFTTSPFDSFRTNEAKAWKAAQEAQGISIVTSEQLDQAEAMAHAVMESSEMCELGPHETEVAMYATLGGMTVKGMVDIAPKMSDSLIDLKSITSIESQRNLERTVISLGYHWQAALYLDLWNAATGENRTEFLFAFVEKGAPYEVAWLAMGESMIDQGRSGYMNAIMAYQQALRTNIWRKTIEGIHRMEAPAWLE